MKIATWKINSIRVRLERLTEDEICRAGRQGLVNWNDPRAAALVEERARTGKVRGEMTFNRKDGTTFPVEGSSVIMPGPEPRAFVILKDITERKRIEEQVSRSQKTFSELVERAPFGIYVVDSQFRIAQMNVGSQNGAFRNVRPVIGRDFAEAMRILWPEPVATGIIAHFRHTLETGEPFYSPRFTNPRHDVDDVESYEWELHRMTLPDGQYGVVCYYFDSTPLRQAEAVVREERDRLTALLNSIRDEVWFADATGKFTLVNPSGSREFNLEVGAPTDARQLATSLEVLRPDGTPRPVEEAPALRALRGEVLTNQEELLRTPATGEMRHRQVSAAPVHNGSGHIIGSVAVVRDITERRRAEEALLASELRQTFLLKLSDRLGPLSDPIEIQYQAARVLGEHLGANRVGYAEAEKNGETLVVTHNYTNGAPDIAGRYRCDDYGPGLLQAFQAGQATVRNDIANDSTLTAAEKAAHATLHMGATLNKPILKGGQLLFVLFVSFPAAHEWTAEEMILVEETAERTWAAVERARAEESLRRSEERLRVAQRAARVGPFEWNIQTGLEVWSPELEAMHGLQPGQFPQT